MGLSDGVLLKKGCISEVSFNGGFPVYYVISWRGTKHTHVVYVLGVLASHNMTPKFNYLLIKLILLSSL